MGGVLSQPAARFPVALDGPALSAGRPGGDGLQRSLAWVRQALQERTGAPPPVVIFDRGMVSTRSLAEPTARGFECGGKVA